MAAAGERAPEGTGAAIMNEGSGAVTGQPCLFLAAKVRNEGANGDPAIFSAGRVCHCQDSPRQ